MKARLQLPNGREIVREVVRPESRGRWLVGLCFVDNCYVTIRRLRTTESEWEIVSVEAPRNKLAVPGDDFEPLYFAG